MANSFTTFESMTPNAQIIFTGRHYEKYTYIPWFCCLLPQYNLVILKHVYNIVRKHRLPGEIQVRLSRSQDVDNSDPLQ